MADPRWLDTDEAARYISVRPDSLQRLVRQGRIPRPDYTLGPRSPRWDRLALDAAFDAGTASTDVRLAFQGLADEIAAEGRQHRARREATASRRVNKGIPLHPEKSQATTEGSR